MASSGWGSLGQALAGTNTTESYQKGQLNAARLGSILADAQMKVDERMAREQLQSSLLNSGRTSGEADLLATALRGGFDPTKISGYTGDMQEQGFRGDAVARALAGDWNNANANLLGVANGPVELAAVQGQNLINNRLLEGGGGITTTEQGRSAIATDAAQAAASRASAANSYASAARTKQNMGIDAAQFALQRDGRWDPDGSGKAAGAVGRPLSAPTINKLAEDAEKLQSLQSLQSGFQDGFAGNGFGGQAENFIGRLMPSLATAGQPEWWQQYDRQKNVIRNELFGAALTPSEQAEFDKADINPNMAPSIIRSNLARQQSVVQGALQRQARTWAAQGYNTNAIREATGLEDFGGSAVNAFRGRLLNLAAASRRARHPQLRPGLLCNVPATPATGQTLVLINGQWVPE